MTTHELKTWPEPFTAILEGRKTHEIRRSDRPFAVGDTLHLREWSPPHDDVHGWYTGREVLVRVTYLTSGGSWGLPDDLCVMSIDASQPLESAAFTQAVGDTPISAVTKRDELAAEVDRLTTLAESRWKWAHDVAGVAESQTVEAIAAWLEQRAQAILTPNRHCLEAQHRAAGLTDAVDDLRAGTWKEQP